MSKPNAFTLNLQQLHNFDDEVVKDFDAQLSGIVADCKRRPGCSKKRSVTLKVEATPNEADSHDVDVTMTIKSTMPAAKHVVRKGRSTKTNQLQFSFEEEPDLDE